MLRYSYTFYLTMLLPLVPFFLGSCYVLAASVWARTVKKSHVRCAPNNNAMNARPSAMGDARRTMGDKRGAQRPTMRRTRGALPPREVLPVGHRVTLFGWVLAAWIVEVCVHV